jgi:hypothetical protein
MKYKCRNCGDVLESKHRHDWVSCSCFVSSNRSSEKIVELLEERAPAELSDYLTHQIRCAIAEVIGTGFYVDGGQDYTRVGGNINDIEEIKE